MALKLRRGTDVARLTITPSEGELLYTTDTKKIFVGDGSTLGGKLISGVNPGAALGNLAFYQSNGAELEGSPDLSFSSVTNLLQVSRGTVTVTNESTARPMVVLNSAYSGTNLSGSLNFSRSRGSLNNPQIVQSGDFVGSTTYEAYNGVAFDSITSVSSFVSAAPTQQGPAFAVNFVSKTGTGPYYVTYSFVAQPQAPTQSRAYEISGNSNANYNGAYRVFSSTTSQMTLFYTTDPGVFGTGATTARLEPVVPGSLIFATETQNGNLLRTAKLFDNGLFFIGPLASEYTNVRPLDPLSSGQLAINTTTTNAGQTAASSQVTLRTYANTSFGQSFNVLRYRGTLTSPTSVLSGDELQIFKWYGGDGTSAAVAATLKITADNTVSTGKVPGAFTFQTANTSSGVLTDAVKIDSNQQTTFYGAVKRNGLEIISPNYISVSTSASYALSLTTSTNVLIVQNPGLTATLTLPSTPVDGQVCSFSVVQEAVVLAVGGSPTVIPSDAGSAAIGTTFRYVFRATPVAAWYRIG